MKKQRFRGRTAAIAVGLGLTAVVATYLATNGAAETTEFRFVDVERGDVADVVSATGTLSAVETVQVGTQVSGQVAELLADFNDTVKQGQLIARIDPTQLRQTVLTAEASLQRQEAEVAQAQREYDRVAQLRSEEFVTQAEYESAAYQLEVAKANLKSAQVSVERARSDLGYTEIRAPVDGVVVERNVDVGQTVAASLSAPQLFLIANDLAEMQILASVDESDIGKIEPGQDVTFTVQAYPDRQYSAEVRQVRLQSSSQDNVVSYTVVVDVDNADGELLPGMTATVEFVVARENDVLKVPNAALRYQPSGDQLAEIRARRTEVAAGEQGRTRGRRPADERAVPSGSDGRPEMAGRSGGMLWTVDEAGDLVRVPVATGISDGQFTVVTSERLEAGVRVVAGVQSASSSAASSTSNPFQQRQQQPGGFRRGGGGIP